jgi:Thioredoxin-like/PUB domain
MLAELYQVLKESHPTHGLEIVFVSSDRDEASFAAYFGSMPWLAIPYESLDHFKPQLSAMHNVTGIPALVILDSMSGQVVVPNNQSRQDVMQACRSGDDAIKVMLERSWLPRVPAESQQLLDLLTMSSQVPPSRDVKSRPQTSPLRSTYLVRQDYADRENRIQSLSLELVDEGMEPDEAREAALAVEAATLNEEQASVLELDAGPLNGLLRQISLPQDSAPTDNKQQLMDPCLQLCRDMVHRDKAGLESVLTTAAKYLSNCMISPWTVRFRHIRLSFKVADEKITRVVGGWQLLESLGFEVYCTAEDFCACIPVHADLAAMQEAITKARSKLGL